MNQNQIIKNLGYLIVTAQVCIVNIIIVALSISIGMCIDSLLKIRPLFTITLVIASIPLSIYIIKNMVVRYIDRNQK